MSTPRTFAPHQVSVLDAVSMRAEELAGDYYHLGAFGPRRYLYEVATHETLLPDEHAEGAFAHLCRYVRSPGVPGERQRADRYYRICLQDPQILQALSRPEASFDLRSLLLYIMTHELIHIVRFERFWHPFVTDPEERELEEQQVHRITHDLLAGTEDPLVSALLSYYSTHRMPRCL